MDALELDDAAAADRQRSTPFDGLRTPLGALTFDDAFGDVEPGAELVDRAAARHGVAVSFDEGYPYAQVFAPAEPGRRRARADDGARRTRSSRARASRSLHAGRRATARASPCTSELAPASTSETSARSTTARSCVAQTTAVPCSRARPHEQLGDRGGAVAVEARRRLVGEQQRGPRRERARDGDACPLARREPRDRHVEPVREPDRLARLARGCGIVADACARAARARRSRARRGTARARSPAGRCPRAAGAAPRARCDRDPRATARAG